MGSSSSKSINKLLKHAANSDQASVDKKSQDKTRPHVSHLLVYGYIRLLQHKSIPDEIINIIHSFFLLTIPSEIIDIADNITFMTKVSSKFKSIISFELLYSSIKHGLSRASYNKHCHDTQDPYYIDYANNNKRINLLIIKNKAGHICGAYREWGDKDWNKNAFFLFVISPEMYIFDKTPGTRPNCCFPGLTVFNLYKSAYDSQDFLVMECKYSGGNKLVAATLDGRICVDGIDVEKMYGSKDIFNRDGNEVIEMEVFTAVKYQ